MMFWRKGMLRIDYVGGSMDGKWANGSVLPEKVEIPLYPKQSCTQVPIPDEFCVPIGKEIYLLRRVALKGRPRDVLALSTLNDDEFLDLVQTRFLL